MSDSSQTIIFVTPSRLSIAWEMRADDGRRIGHGSENPGDWSAIRGLEIRSGIPAASVRADISKYPTAAGYLACQHYGWTLVK